MLNRSNEGFGLIHYSNRLVKKFSLLDLTRSSIFEAPARCGRYTAMLGYVNSRASEGDLVFLYRARNDAPEVQYRNFCLELAKIDERAGCGLLKINIPDADTIAAACELLRNIRCKKRTWLIIDDFHFLFSALPIELARTLLDSICDELHILLGTEVLGDDLYEISHGRMIPYVIAQDLQWQAEDIREYFAKCEIELSDAEADEVYDNTGGWIVAVRWLLSSFLEMRSFSKNEAFRLVDKCFWSKMSGEQRDLWLKMSLFGSFSEDQLCSMLNVTSLPLYAIECLALPFVEHQYQSRIYTPNAFFRSYLREKMAELDDGHRTFLHQFAGQACIREGKLTKALAVFCAVKDYERILSIDVSKMVREETNNDAIYDVAIELKNNCSEDIKRKNILAMLSFAWVIRLKEDVSGFKLLMRELDGYIPDEGLLRAEWTLLSVYFVYPDLEKMLEAVKAAAALFDGECSRVILQCSPWAFYEYSQLAAFHIEVGAAEREASKLEQFVKIYSPLTGGHGMGAYDLFYAELQFFKCETSQAEVSAYKARFLAEQNKQGVIHLGAARLLASISIINSDAEKWQSIIESVEKSENGEGARSSFYQKMLNVYHALLLAQFSDYDRYPEWLKSCDFSNLSMPFSIYAKAVAAHGFYLMGKEKYAKLIAFLDSASLDGMTPFVEHFHLFSMAVGYSAIGDKSSAFDCIRRAAQMSLPDGLLHSFTGFSKSIQE